MLQRSQGLLDGHFAGIGNSGSTDLKEPDRLYGEIREIISSYILVDFC